jgi:DNA-binding transcriptional MerR regulator
VSSYAAPGITIGDLAEQTGLTVATLRAWESRYGLPTPRRSPSGHRRYSPADAEQVRQVLRLRAGGLSLEAAIARARDLSSAPATPRSVFAEVRRTHPELTPAVLSQRAMLAISTAIEDECCAVAAEPLLMGFFQHERFYRSRQPRWRELARTASAAFVFADFAQSATPADGPVEIALPATTPLLREWVLLCQAPDATAVLAGWELPPQSGPRTGRRFEAVWSLGPAVTATAARTALAYATASAPALVPTDPPPVVVPDETAVLTRATAVTNRIVAYLDR